VKTTAETLRNAIFESLKRNGHCYVSHMNGTNQARRIYSARVRGRMLQLRVCGVDEMEWYVVAVRDQITLDKLTRDESTTIVGAL